MRLSIVVGTHNEGKRLLKTIGSIVETAGDLEYELVVADDASSDGSVREAKRHYPQIEVVRNRRRLGVSATRSLGVERARGRTLIFLDGHTKPAKGALKRLLQAVEATEGRDIITPRIVGLDTEMWEESRKQSGNGYAFDLETFDTWWVPLSKMEQVKEAGYTFYESPSIIGCAFAISMRLYRRLHGFDPHMQQWGVEDLDLSLKCWTMGSRILHLPEP